jgi:RNA polymerase sigma-70 factor (ECF subfamily)
VRTEDGYIIYKCLNGEKEAFGLLVDKYKQGVYALAYSKLLNFHDAQDIVQEVFIKAYEKLGTLRRWDSFMAWLYAITSNLCKNRIQTQSRQPDREFIKDRDPTAINRASLNSHREDMALESLRDALDSIPEMYCRVLTLFYYGGMTIKDIARFLGSSPRTVKRRLSEARSLLREEMLSTIEGTADEHRLHDSFTFVIVEAVKRMKIQPMPRATSLSWGLSLAMGIIIIFMSLGHHLGLLKPPSFPTGPPFPAESGVLRVGELPIDIVEIPWITALGSKRRDMADTPVSIFPMPAEAEAAEDTEGNPGSLAAGAGRYIIVSYGEVPGEAEFARGWSEVEASGLGVLFGSYRSIGRRTREPVPRHTVFDYAKSELRGFGHLASVGGALTTTERCKQHTTVENSEATVTVPAGTFRNCVKLTTALSHCEAQIQRERNSLEGTRHIWFAAGVGLVKLEYHHNDNTTTNIELVGYSVSEKSEGYFPVDQGNRWTYEWTNGYRNFRVRETSAILPADVGTIAICRYLSTRDEPSRDEVKEACKFTDEELDAAVEPLLKWQLVDRGNGKLQSYSTLNPGTSRIGLRGWFGKSWFGHVQASHSF